MWNRTFERAADIPSSVFLIDENEDTRDMYALFLGQSGLAVTATAAPPAVLDTIDELRPKVVVVNFGGLRARDDEIAFLRAVRSRPSTTEARRIVLHSAPECLLPAETRTISHLCLLKPVMPDDLLSGIRSLLARAREVREESLRLHARAATLARRSARLVAAAQRGAIRLSQPP